MKTCAICGDTFIRFTAWGSEEEPCACGAMVTRADLREFSPRQEHVMRQAWADSCALTNEGPARTRRPQE